MNLLDEVAKTIEKNTLLSPGARVLVGVSGGADSLCLMHALDKLGYEVIVAHLDHQLRPDSAQEATYVEEIAAQHRLNVVSERLQGVAQSNSIEEAGRIHRYAFFLRIAIKLSLKRIAVGHTADDQSETILMHFLRGTGPEGLRGMLPKRSMAQWGAEPHSAAIILIRPLLKVPRSMIVDYVEKVGLKPLQDPSNYDVSFTRNRIRHEVLPLLKELNPGMDKTLQRMADIMHAEVELLDETLDDAMLQLSVRDEKDRITFNRKLFLKLHPALQRALLRRLLGASRLNNGAIGFEAIENALRFLRKPDAWGALAIGNDLELQRFSEKVLVRETSAKPLLADYPQLSAAMIFKPNTESMTLGQGWAITASEEELSPKLQKIILGNQDRSRAFLDATVLSKSPALRTSKVGERFQALGMMGSTKLSDFFINHKIPRPARKNWPLFASDEEIYWVVGLQIAESFRIRDDTARLLRLELVPK